MTADVVAHQKEYVLLYHAEKLVPKEEPDQMEFKVIEEKRERKDVKEIKDLKDLKEMKVNQDQ
jgi:hypothetical protein